VHAVAELESGWWFYRFRAGTFTSPTGRAQTAPAADSAAEARFASASCQNYQNGYYTAHRDIADQQPDFVVWLGDYIYEGDSYPIDGANVVRSHGTPEVRTLDDYRNRYALYRGDADLQASHAACPWYVIWDDHEVENNYASLIPENPEEAPDFAARRAAAYQAWWEHMPVALPPPNGTDEYRIYRSFRWGSLLDLALLDGRQYRSDQACGDPGLSLDPACPETFDPDRTMLGAEQEAWLIDTLDAATSTWRVIGNQTVFGDLTLAGAVLNYDQWDGYPADRSAIVDRLAADAVPNVVVLTGDIHLAGTGTIRAGERRRRRVRRHLDLVGWPRGPRGDRGGEVVPRHPRRRTGAPRVHPPHRDARGVDRRLPHGRVGEGRGRADVHVRHVSGRRRHQHGALRRLTAGRRTLRP
jgi:alkaline phosphatase D